MIIRHTRERRLLVCFARSLFQQTAELSSVLTRCRSLTKAILTCCLCPALQLHAHHLGSHHSFVLATLSDQLHALVLQNIHCIAGTCCAAMGAWILDTCTTGSIQPATQDFALVVSGGSMITCHPSAVTASPYCTHVHLVVGLYTCITHCWMIHSKSHLHCSTVCTCIDCWQSSTWLTARGL